MARKDAALSRTEIDKILKGLYFSEWTFEDTEMEGGTFYYNLIGIHTGTSVQIEVRSFEDEERYNAFYHEVHARVSERARWKEVTPNYKPF